MLRLARARRPKLRAFTMLRHPVDQFYSFWRFLRYCASYDVEGMQAPPPNRPLAHLAHTHSHRSPTRTGPCT